MIDSHPVDVCRPVRERKKVRLGGIAKKGYCSSLERWFIGLREHMVFTPDGRIAFMLQLAGNRHDVQGLYAFFDTSFRGCLLADNGYWPKPDKRVEMNQQREWMANKLTRSSEKSWLTGAMHWYTHNERTFHLSHLRTYGSAYGDRYVVSSDQPAGKPCETKTIKVFLGKSTAHVRHARIPPRICPVGDPSPHSRAFRAPSSEQGFGLFAVFRYTVNN